MRVLKIVHPATWPRLAIVVIAGLGLAGCYDNGGDPKVQIGANPMLRPLQQYLIPPIRIRESSAVGKETPTVPHGLQVQALATGFEHPRSLYILPNGDVLVVEGNGPKAPIHRPKDLVTGWVQWLAGAPGKGGNRITLLRDTKGDGTFSIFPPTCTRRYPQVAELQAGAGGINIISDAMKPSQSVA